MKQKGAKRVHENGEISHRFQSELEQIHLNTHQQNTKKKGILIISTYNEATTKFVIYDGKFV